MSAAITLAPIPAAEVPALRQMWELYVRDFSAFVPRQPGPDGRLESDEGFSRMIAPPLELLWIRLDGRVTGFVFIRPHSHLDGDPTVSDVAQFFVLPSHRRTGVGRAAAALAFARRPGRWEVREMAVHTAAQQFWRRAISDHTRGHYAERDLEKAGVRWVVRSFTTEARPTPSIAWGQEVQGRVSPASPGPPWSDRAFSVNSRALDAAQNARFHGSGGGYGAIYCFADVP